MERLRWIPGAVAVAAVVVAWSETLYYPTDAGPWWLVWWYLPYVLVGLWLLPGGRLRWQHVALAGWLLGTTLEGSIVAVLYEDLPGSIVYPALGWHMLVSTLVGVLGIGVALRSDRSWATPATAVAAGVALGAWWPLWLVDGPLGTVDVVVPIVTGTAVVAVGHAVLLHVRLRRPPRWLAGLSALAITGLAVAQVTTLPTAPVWFVLATAPPVVLLLRGRRRAGTQLPDLRDPTRLPRIAWLALVPVTALATWEVLGGDAAVADLLAVGQVVGGAVVGLAAVVRAWRGDRAEDRQSLVAAV